MNSILPNITFIPIETAGDTNVADTNEMIAVISSSQCGNPNDIVAITPNIIAIIVIIANDIVFDLITWSLIFPYACFQPSDLTNVSFCFSNEFQLNRIITPNITASVENIIGESGIANAAIIPTTPNAITPVNSELRNPSSPKYHENANIASAMIVMNTIIIVLI